MWYSLWDKETEMKSTLKSIAHIGTLVCLFLGPQVIGCAPTIQFTKPVAKFDEKSKSQITVPKVASPVKVCMGVKGYILKPIRRNPSTKGPAKVKVADPASQDDDGYGDFRENTIDKGSGHFHLLIDVRVAENEDLNLHMKKDKNHFPLVKGEPCKVLSLAPGFHWVQVIFAYENHTPVQPILTKSMDFFVKF